MSTNTLDRVASTINGAAPASNDEIIKLAILAVGGQGGGVLTNWIVDVAERNGFVAQSTSVPGVAQRTGATVYYVEMCATSEQEPVLALMPSPGDVDIVVAAEAMEAGRAVTRGFVTPDRTTLIASSHRMYAVSEKVVPGDGIASSERVIKAVGQSAKDLICHDLAAIAERHSSHISASLLGALAGSKCLPFEREQFEETIRASGRGVTASLKAFGDAFNLAAGTGDAAVTQPRQPAHSDAQEITVPAKHQARWQGLLDQLATLPKATRQMAQLGLEKVVDYQDLDYGQEYLDVLQAAAAKDAKQGGDSRSYEFSTMLAKYLANAMCYDDVIRVADLKTRSSRFARVRRDLSVDDDAVVKITEYMHPRAEEVIGMMPMALGRFVERKRWLYRFVEARCRKGRRWRSDALAPFLTLYALGGLRPWRRRLLRHQRESEHLRNWLNNAMECLESDYDTAVAIIKARRLIKGYSDTHARGLSKFDRVLTGLALLEGRPDASQWADRLMAAALSDAKSDALEGTIQTIQSFAKPKTDTELAQ